MVRGRLVAQTFNCGDGVTRTIGGVNEKIILPPINMAHLINATVSARGRVDGLHILPVSAGRITSLVAMTFPTSVINVLDAHGAPITDSQVRLTPRRVPTSDFDAFEAKIEVVDAAGNVLGTTSEKSFYPQFWLQFQIQQAIYSAYVQSFQAGGGPCATRMSGVTPEGVYLEMRVNGTQSSTGVRLTAIPTAFLISGQSLTAQHLPK